jgi:hypothetical protein
LWAVAFRSTTKREGLRATIISVHMLSLGTSFVGTAIFNILTLERWPEFGWACCVGFVHFALSPGFLELYEDRVEQSQFVRKIFMLG